MSNSKSKKDKNLPKVSAPHQVREVGTGTTSNSQIKIQQEVVKAARYSGPLPRPEDLKVYNEIIPNAAERILRMAEENAKHRHQLEKFELETEAGLAKSAIKIESRNSLLGLLFAFIICILAIGGGIYTAIIGAHLAGSFISIAALTSLVGAFIVGSKQRSKEKTSQDPPKSQIQEK
jgi:uncharacterized membrane protein